ncbi:PREDICTED: IQ domain-containing protein G-like [Nicrophorus vespilloides]|uniref:Dynein regulatory complex protein 9 n=1 Tax=Nicrophorus vespilloides TaxID=110193 RepID=A0ABM1M6K3_NICVS|nr:PREDICTED: IQ domain-containing protein G-like [Nicrophorus vespilloides]
MPKIRDKATITWIVNGEEVDEDVILYDEDEENVDFEKEEEHESSEKDFDTFEHDLMCQIDMVILNDVLEKVAILKAIAQKDLKPCEFKFPKYKSIEERYGDKIDYGGEFYSEAKKRLLDLTTLYSVIFKTIEDIWKLNSIASLVEGTSILKKLYREENELFHDDVYTIQVENDMKNKLLTQGGILDKQYKDKLELLRRLELEFERSIGYGNLEYKYMERWEYSRKHQGKIMLEDKEAHFEEIVNNSQMQMELQKRIHTDIVRYFEESQEDMQSQIQYWMDRYEEEVEVRDAELLRMRMERDQQMEYYLAQKAMYEEHAEFVIYWGAIREERRIAAEIFERETKAAIRIQAWWRGLMVRKKLGRFGKKKRGKKGKGGKDAKKDKKKKK